MNALSPLWQLLLLAIAATYVWRFTGVILSIKIDTESSIFQWFTCVSYAMLAGLVSRMILIPVGPLIGVELWIRLSGVISGLLVYFFAGRRLLLAVCVGICLFVLLVLWTSAL